MSDHLVDFLDRRQADAEDGAYQAGYQRAVKIIDAPVREAPPLVELDDARRIIQDAMREYAALSEPEHILLIKAQPGVGKTHAGVRLAESLAMEGRRVLYAAPRHDFITDLRAIATNPANIYEWLPRQAGSETKDETCRHTEKINIWLHRGYEAMDFCSQVCGWDYVKICPYHVQKKRPEPIIMCQHQHLTSGHPLTFDFVIGDESPLATFQHQWIIPGRWLMPAGMSHDEPLTEILHELSKLTESKTVLSGAALLKVLGGADHVLAACSNFSMPATAVAIAPSLHQPEDADKAAYFHLPQLVPLLAREAQAAKNGKEYPHRIVVENGNLMLMLRRDVNATIPRHVVWLDATGNEHLYREIFKRTVQVIQPNIRMAGRVIQVTDRANGKASLVKDGKETGKARQLIEQINQIVEKNDLQNAGLVTFQEFSGRAEFSHLNPLHFFAARGSNVQQQVDGLIVAGTPQPSLLDIDKQARMLFFERMTPFNLKWTLRDIPYHFVDSNGKGRAYPTSGFWHDADLSAVLWQYREAELLQAVHRSRLVVRPVTVWLLSNLPIWELPPRALYSIHDINEAPPGVDPWLWPQVMKIANLRSAETGCVTTHDLMKALSIDARTARKYIDLLSAQPQWTAAAAPRQAAGRPIKAAQRIKYIDIIRDSDGFPDDSDHSLENFAYTWNKVH